MFGPVLPTGSEAQKKKWCFLKRPFLGPLGLAAFPLRLLLHAVNLEAVEAPGRREHTSSETAFGTR